MATVATLTTSIREIIRTDAIIDLDILSKMNEAVYAIAAGITLPDNRISSPLPELYKFDTVATTANAYADLPATYQRNIFYVVDADASQIPPLDGGDYYSFDLFLNSITKQDLSETGSIKMVAIKGLQIYYQGIPAVSENMTLHFYRKPVAMSEADDTPDGIPEQFQIPLIKHYVCRDIFGDILEGNTKGRYGYHSGLLEKTLINMMDFIGNDISPTFWVAGGDYAH